MWITHDDECWLCYVRMNTSLNKDGVNHCLFVLLCSLQEPSYERDGEQNILVSGAFTTWTATSAHFR